MTISRPISQKSQDTVDQWERQRRARMAEEEERRLRGDPPKRSVFDGNSEQRNYDSRLSYLLGIATLIVSGVAVYGITNIGSAFLDLREDVAVLVSRPTSVSKEQYDRDMETLRAEQKKTAQSVERMEDRLETIQQRQQSVISKYP